MWFWESDESCLRRGFGIITRNEEGKKSQKSGSPVSSANNFDLNVNET